MSWARESGCANRKTKWRPSVGSGSALQRGHSASLEPLAQRNDALSVGNELVIIIVVPTKTVVTEPGGSKHSSAAVSMGADIKANTWGVG